MKIIKLFPPDLVEARIRNLTLLRSLRKHQAYLASRDSNAAIIARGHIVKPSQVGRNHIPVSEIALPDTAHAVRMGHKIRWHSNPFTETLD